MVERTEEAPCASQGKQISKTISEIHLWNPISYVIWSEWKSSPTRWYLMSILNLNNKQKSLMHFNVNVQWWIYFLILLIYWQWQTHFTWSERFTQVSCPFFLPRLRATWDIMYNKYFLGPERELSWWSVCFLSTRAWVQSPEHWLKKNSPA